MLSPLSQITDRVAKAREDSDIAYFFELLNAGEMIMKLATVAFMACLDDDRERNRYRLEFGLVHADSLGNWSSAMDDALTGPASHVIISDARGVQRELTQNFRTNDSEWQSQAVRLLHQAHLAVDQEIKPLPNKVAVRRWFSDFVALRNRTRGHGATTGATCSNACAPLHDSITHLVDNFTLFRWHWCHLHRNLSGKYRVSDVGNGTSPFEVFKSSREHSLRNGIYLWAGTPCYIALLATDSDVRDFYLPNGNFKEDVRECLSYITDTRLAAPAAAYIDPPTALPVSETQGRGDLEVIGQVFANLPPSIGGYVERAGLEDELTSVLTDEHHPVITLVGRGGIGKTSLALEVLHKLAAADRYFAMIWFSSRDIELLPHGPVLVQPHVLSPEEIAAEYVNLVAPTERTDKNFNAVDFFSKALSEPESAPTLFVFDNFETVRSPQELHRWLDTYIRPPNKILITTRSRDFKGDYWVEVGGMTEAQFSTLVQKTASELNVNHLIDPQYTAELYRESDGHPYIAKVLLGEVARAGKQQKVARIMASQDRVLEALFERTFTHLAPAAQRVFLTLSNWRSLVPIVALDAAVNRPDNERMDVNQAVDELHRSSLLQIANTESGDVYLAVPLSAALFGRRKLATSPVQASVEADTEVLRLFGVVPLGGVRHGLPTQIERLFQNVAERVHSDPKQFERYQPVLEFVAREVPIGWILLGQLLEEARPGIHWEKEVADAYRRYLESVPNDGQIWLALAQVCRNMGDHLSAAQALVRRASLAEAPYADISYAALRLNSYVADGVLNLDTDEKRILITSLTDTMAKRQNEANATDLSRLAWLLINVRRRADAKGIVKEALGFEPTNTHCRKLAERLKIPLPK